MNRASAVIYVCVLAASFGHTAGAAERLRYKMSADERTYYRVVTSVKLTQMNAGVESTSSITTSEVTESSLLGHTRGVFKIQSAVKRLQVDLADGTLGKYNFDSDASTNDKDTILGQALTPLYEGMTTLLLVKSFTDRGTVVSIKGYEGLVIGAIKNNPITAQFAVGANEQSAKVSFAEQYIEFPEKDISPGDTWEVPLEMTFGEFGTVTGKRVYKYVGNSSLDLKKAAAVEQRKLVKISVATDFKFDINVNKNGLMVSGVVAVKDSSGEALFDPVLGRVRSRKQTLNLEADLKITANNETRSIKQTQVQQVTVDLLAEFP